jgi:hypothetical protein
MAAVPGFVEFDGQLRFVAEKINDTTTDRMLAAELDSRGFSVSQT